MSFGHITKSAALPASEQKPGYTVAIGEAAERYFDSFGQDFRVKTPATFRFRELWDAMASVAFANSPDSAARIKELEAGVERLGEVVMQTVRHGNKQRNDEVAALKEKLRVARGAMLVAKPYCKTGGNARAVVDMALAIIGEE